MESRKTINSLGTIRYSNENNQRHREDGPAVEYSNGTKAWYINGQIHREDGPAREYSNGHKEWYLNGELHREDGPAIESSNGTKSWWINGKRHREDGPAIEYSDGSKSWYLNGERHSEESFIKITQRLLTDCLKFQIKNSTMKKTFLILFVMLIAFQNAFAQRQLTGSVKDATTNLPLTGANIMIQGTKNGVTTSADGKFSILLTKDAKNIIVSYVGFEPKTLSNQLNNVYKNLL